MTDTDDSVIELDEFIVESRSDPDRICDAVSEGDKSNIEDFRNDVIENVQHLNVSKFSVDECETSAQAHKIFNRFSCFGITLRNITRILQLIFRHSTTRNLKSYFDERNYESN